MLLEALPKEERDAILDPKKSSNKLPAKETKRPETTPNPEVKVDEANPTPESSRKQGKKKEDAGNEQASNSFFFVVHSYNKLVFTRVIRLRPREGPRKFRTLKNLQRCVACNSTTIVLMVKQEKERQEKKAARQEKEKKEKDVQNKSQSLMAKFFSKPKASISGRKPQVNAVAGPSKIQTDFERVFKPFALGRDKVLAPQNWFQAQKKHARRAAVAQGSDREVIVLESEDESDVVMTENYPSEKDLESMTSQGILDVLTFISWSNGLQPAYRIRCQTYLIHYYRPPAIEIHQDSRYIILSQSVTLWLSSLKWK